MALKKFPLPDVGEGLTEAEIVGWKVQPGENVTVNQVIVEIETAKASVELPCPWAGTIRDLLVEPGQTVEVGTPIISIEMAGADPEPELEPDESSGKIGEESNGRIATLVGYGPRTSAAKRRPRKDRHAATNGTPTNGTATATAAAPPEPAEPQVEEVGGFVPLAKPPVRKLAKDLGVDLRSLAGSGSGGVITRDDVQSAAAPTAAPAKPPAAASGDRERRVPIKGVRKATAQAMVDSAFTAPHVTEFLTVDVTPMMELREQLKSDPAFRGVKITPLAFAAKAMCLAARRTPDVNATWDESAGEIVYKDYVHLGVAAATPRGLVVPKVRDADRMSLRELAEALEQLTNTAREGKTTPADMLGGTITITNVGVFGVDTGTPIINPGESAIFAFGAIRDMPWVVDGQVVPRKVCQLALSFDHRVVDGQQGSQYLADVGALLANPSMAFTY
ncbi:2-oxo acid dehydrogenase subunit E2 [Saccharopolyspora karakumensis]|uniref:Dihydrolipoamide acetyltransferase component of pyruvate dehydrogenase complex n=1 Tax=Saccharopolyspora karakumensis TaxID=2530386 RepID=A0A4R5BHU7_9PSEU|nr:dihydrolipoamide acetyltransferase family protein [Saccharopolyspora karakumensis]TDD85315.1 2-oxo acid dehydrogenase subunit E2 [Saccharopolyspora karakumensis]